MKLIRRPPDFRKNLYKRKIVIEISIMRELIIESKYLLSHSALLLGPLRQHHQNQTSYDNRIYSL